MMRKFFCVLLVGCSMAAAPLTADDSWATTDWPEYMEFLQSLQEMPDDELATITNSPPVVYGFLLAAGEVLDGIALSREYAAYRINVRRHANRCAYRYISDRFSYQSARESGPMDWPYGGLIFAAQEAFDECLVINIENDDDGGEALTRYLSYSPPATD